MQDLRIEEYPGMHRYADPRGMPELSDAVLERVRNKSGLAYERESVLISAGATAGLASAVGALVAPGREVLILAPFWPLIRGMVQLCGGVPVEVPFYDRVDSAQTAVEAVRERMSDRTVALYVSSPSNPTGRVLPESWLAALAELAEQEGWWLLSDEVYEEFVYRGSHVSIGSFAPARTLTFYSFSKSYGMSGNRVGVVVGPRDAIRQAAKISTHTSYGAPTAGQIAALRALEDGDAWIENARTRYREAGEAVARELSLPPPEGSTFFFIDVGKRLDERGLSGFLEDCFEAGVLVAPGGSCGSDYTDWVRLCYTAMNPGDVIEAARRLASCMRSAP